MKHKFSSMGRVAIALVLALSLSLVMAVPVMAADLTDVSATPADATEDQTTTYDIGFTTATTYSVETVDIVFDTGFTGTAVLVEATGIGAGTISDASLPDITYTVTAPAVIDTGTAITITFSGVVNPADGDYEVTVTTMDGLTTVDTGTADVTITPLPAEFEVVAGTNNSVTAGEAFSVEITALQDDLVTPETGYTGDHFITFTTGGAPTGTIPGFGLISFTNGVGTSLQTFILTDATETDNTIIATDELSVAGTSEAITINLPALVDYFVITDAPASVTAGEAFGTDVTVTAYDAEGNVKTDYTGTVSWTSTDPSAELPDADALVAGTCTFDAADFILKTVLLDEAGSPIDTTITVTGDGVPATASITVDPAAASEIGVTAAPTSIRADNINASTITATAYDEFGNVDTAFAETATFAVSLGTLSDEDASFGTITDGVATATLKSDGVVGTATVKVTPGTLSPYKTVTVTLVAPSLLAEVWVAPPPTGDDANSGTEAEPFATIPAAIAASAEGGTITVASGTYTPAASGVFVIKVEKELTIQAAAGSTPVIEAVRDGVSAFHVIEIQANNVTIDGFTIVAGTDTVNGDWGIYVNGARENFVIQNNTATGFDDTNDVGIRAMNAILTEETGGLIKDNVSETNSNGIEVSNCQYVTIQGNLVQSNSGDGISLFSGSSDITVIENKVYSNEGGIFAQVGSTGIFHYNDIVGSGTWYGLKYEGTVPIDATNNWWGDASGPTHVSNPDGTGDTVGATTYFVDYTPWLDAAYAEPATTISLGSGWNLISLMLLPTDPDIDTVLAGADVTVNKVAYFTGGPAGTWKSWFPSPTPIDLYMMDDGKGYWIDVSAAGELTVTGVELALPGESPPTYDVVVGWNLIGFTSTTGKTVDVYLGSVLATVEAMYGYNAATGLYEAVLAGNNLASGQGYWLAVNTAGKIYP